MKSLINNHIGSSLLMVIVIVAISIGVLTQAPKIIRTMKKETKEVVIGQEEAMFLEQAEVLLSNPEICTNTFKDVPLSNNSQVTSIKGSGGDILSSSGKYDHLSLKKISIRNLTNASVAASFKEHYSKVLGANANGPYSDLETPTPPAPGPTTKVWHANLEFEIEKNFGKDDSAQNVSRKKIHNNFGIVFYQNDLLTTASKISSCHLITKSTPSVCATLGGLPDSDTGRCFFEQKNPNPCAMFLTFEQILDLNNPNDPTLTPYMAMMRDPINASSMCLSQLKDDPAVFTSLSTHSSYKHPKQKRLGSLFDNSSALCELDKKMVAARGEGLTTMCRDPYYGGCYAQVSGNSYLIRRGGVVLDDRYIDDDNGGQWSRASQIMAGVGTAFTAYHAIYGACPALVPVVALAALIYLLLDCGNPEYRHKKCIVCNGENLHDEGVWCVEKRYRKKWWKPCKWHDPCGTYHNPSCS